MLGRGQNLLEALRQWLAGKSEPIQDWGPLQQWAELRQYVWRDVRGGEGFVVEGRQGLLPWRLEWGPAQRDYVKGMEVRLRADVGVHPELQALVLNRRLQEAMERDVFDQYVEDLQTRVDTRTPPEMRWLVMYSPLSSNELRGLKDRWAAVANVKPWLTDWLAGPLTSELASAPGEPEVPVVVMVARSRLTLRTAMSDPTPEQLESWVHVFECALREARRVGTSGCEEPEQATQPGLFTPSTLDEPAGAH